MNYIQIYCSIISKAKIRELENPVKDYSENHHIIPKCMGGNNDPENLARLTAKEHFICHALLCYIFPNDYNLLSAFNLMRTVKRPDQDRYISGNQYTKLRKDYKIASSKNMIGNTHRLGKPTDPEGCAANSRGLMGNTNRLGTIAEIFECEYCGTKTSKSVLGTYHGPNPGKKPKPDSRLYSCRRISLERNTSW